MTPVILPTIVARRWAEAHARPTMSQWRSMSQMLSSMVVNASLYTPESPLVDDLRTLASVAHAHQIELQGAMPC